MRRDGAPGRKGPSTSLVSVTMASVQPTDTSDAGAPALDSQIWGNEDGGCRGKMTRPRVIGIGLAVAFAALGLGLYFGLAGTGGDSVDRIVGQAIDPNAIGCFLDLRRDRVATDVLVDEAMTPQVSFLCLMCSSRRGHVLTILKWRHLFLTRKMLAAYQLCLQYYTNQVLLHSYSSSIINSNS